MTNGASKETAQIFQFPACGRQAVPRDTLRRQGTVRDLPRKAVPMTDFGSGWYHDEAIAEAKPGHR